MKITYLGALLLLFSLPLCAQTPLSGTINQYAKITSLDPCAAILTVSDPAFFSIGDQVLIIQMQGAIINESNSGSFGNIDELGSAGQYELNEISAITGMDVYLKYALVNEYNVNGSLQLVSVSTHTEAVINDIVTALPWDGQKGGVVAIHVENTLTFEAPIDVSGQGFRGGMINVVTSDCNFLTNADGFHYSLTNWRGAPKGEGIAAIIAGKEQGKGPQANGGGGGNDHNSGGGGGANITLAGDGGKQNVSGFGCDGNHPGKGGKAVDNFNHRIFLGGGGGAGHVDNAGVGTGGGNGGGIVVIIAGQINGNGHTVIANGITPNNGIATNGDGQGGGGAGGSILITADGNIDALRIEAKGGSGGNVNNSSNRCFGPGGGGSGGRLISNENNFAAIDLTGGEAGINTNPSSECSDPSNGADDGLDGIQTAFNGIDASIEEPLETQVLMQPEAAIGCENIQVTFEFQVQGNNLSYQWQVDDGSGWVDIMVDPNFAGINTGILTIFNSDASMNGYKYRCFVTGPCTEDILSLPATLTVIEAPQPGFDYTSLGGGTVQFNNTSENAVSYSWDFGDNMTSDSENPEHTYDLFGAYTVTLTATNDCGSVTFEQVIIVSAPPLAGFTVDITSGCTPLVVQFVNQSSINADSWQWFFPGGMPAASSDENPGVVYLEPGEYEVTLVASNAEGSDTLVVSAAVVVAGPPVVDFMAAINLMEVQFVNLSVNASGGFLWEFGDGTTSTDVSPFHTFADEGYYNVTLTAFNDCGQTSVTQTIATGAFPLAAFNAEFTGNCAPLTVYYTDQSSGSNILSYLWEFEGGVPATSVSPDPVVVYSEPGVYSVKLTVANAVGEHSVELEDYIVVEMIPEADFSYAVDKMAAQFFNNSIGGTYLQWDFGDGEFSFEDDPLHIYEQGGIYDVTLTVANFGCGSAISKQVMIEQLTSATEGRFITSISIYPNPTADFISIEMDQAPPLGTTVQCYDVNGSTAISAEMSNALLTLNVAELPAGMYVVKVENDEWQRFFMVMKE